MKQLIAGLHFNTSGLLLVVQVAAWFGVATAFSGDPLVGAAAGLAAAVVLRLIVRPITQRQMARYTNDREVVATEHGTAGRVDAIEYFWRPG